MPDWRHIVLLILKKMQRKNNPSQAKITKELEAIYENRSKWVKAGQNLRNKFSESLAENPKLNLILKVSIIGNVGIWLTLLSIWFSILVKIPQIFNL